MNKMSNLEHYFENLLYDGADVNGDVNKNALTADEQKAVEVCAQYVIYTLFGGRDELNRFLRVYCKDCKYNNGKSCGWHGTPIVVAGWCSHGEEREQDG